MSCEVRKGGVSVDQRERNVRRRYVWELKMAGRNGTLATCFSCWTTND